MKPTKIIFFFLLCALPGLSQTTVIGGRTGGTVTGTGTDNCLVKWATGSTGVLADSLVCDIVGVLSYSGTEADFPKIVINDGSGKAGAVGLAQGTAITCDANNVCLTAPTSVTAYKIVYPAAAGTGIPRWSNSSNTVTIPTVAELSGDVTTSGSNVTTIAAGAVTEAKQTLADNTTANVSTSAHGYAPKLDNVVTHFLNGQGGYTTPAGGSGWTITPQVGSSDTLTASVISTTETSFATTYQVPANYLVAGKLLRISVIFECTATATVPTFTFRLRWGGTAGSGTPGGTVIYASDGNAPTAIATRGIGTTWLIQGTAAAGASVNVETGIMAAGNGSSASFQLWRNNTAQPVAVPTNANENIVATLQFSTNAASNACTLRQWLTETN